eukprot:TRINITY_DN31_c0_g1_i1.p1 TRINITY_DN31_c0_g1~~TRINITY_DN31_c0_g1_i1.p1  ORF type:complete len:517 (+),score=230.92 TRINITY_DN31_c0_g1_i1:474-2024(+)
METSTKKEPSTTLIYVSNLPFDTNDEQLQELFKGFGIKTAYVAKRKNGKSKGFGFVNLEKESDQNAAIERVNGKELNSRKLIAKIAYNDDRRNENGELREEFKTLTQNRSAPSETVVHVSNLEWTVNDETLRGIFAEFNPKVATVATRRSGKSKGFGFVEFNTKEDQEKALKLNGTSISNRNITVQASTGFKREGGSNENRPRRNDNRRDNNRSDNRPRRNDNRNDNRSDNRSNNRRNDNRNDNRFNVVRRNDRNDNRPERRSENTLYISNLPFELDDNDLRQIFQEFNPKNAHIPTRRNGKSRGYGFVEFSNSKEQTEAQRALDQSEVNGRVVTIKVSQPGSGNRDNSRVTVRRNNDNRRDNNRNNDNRRDNSRNNDNRRDNRNNDNRRDNRNNNDNRRDNNRNNDNRRNNNNTTRPPRNENREISNTLVYVSNLPFNVDDKGLEEVFKGLKLSKAYVARRRNGYSKGFGFVEFASAEDQKKAISQHGSEVSGRAIVVQAAFKVDEKQQTTTNQN